MLTSGKYLLALSTKICTVDKVAINKTDSYSVLVCVTSFEEPNWDFSSTTKLVEIVKPFLFNAVCINYFLKLLNVVWEISLQLSLPPIPFGFTTSISDLCLWEYKHMYILQKFITVFIKSYYIRLCGYSYLPLGYCIRRVSHI